MGIPAFYKWLVDKYPKSIQYFPQGGANKKDTARCNNIQFNNLYIDMNGVIHNSTHSKGEPTVESIIASKPNTDDMIKENLYKRMNDIIDTVNPSNLVYIALDGVPPRAKATEQRKRRFRSAKDIRDILTKGPRPSNHHGHHHHHSSTHPSNTHSATSSPQSSPSTPLVATKAESQSEPSTPTTSITSITSDTSSPSSTPVASTNHLNLLDKVFDSNSISPATEFMDKVNGWIVEYISTVLSKTHPHLTVVLSDTTVPGEGEHKIMDFIRAHHKSWESSTSHIFYGMDADLIFLGLSIHLENFFVLRDYQSSNYGCSFCKSTNHLSYECRSAVAMKKLNCNKDGDFDYTSGITTTKISVRNIPSQASEEDIREIFSYYGTIVKIDFEKAPTKKPSLTAFIEFDSNEAVKDISCRGAYFYINNTKLTIANYYGSSTSMTSSTTEPSTPIEQTKDDDDVTVVEEDDGIYYNNAIFCTRLDASITKEEVIEFFSQCGKVEDVQFLTSPRKKPQPIKFSIITFSNLDEVKKALALDGQMFKGNKLTLKKSRPPTVKEPGTPASREPKVKQTEEQKAEKEAEKEKRRLEKEEKANQFIQVAGHGMNLDSSYFYLGLADWDLEKANEIFIKFDRALAKEEGDGESEESVVFDRKFEFVNLDNLRQYIKYFLTFGIDTGNNFDINNCINDITLMCMLMGNDFLPHLPAVSIKDGSIELILGWYKDWIQKSIKSTGKIKYLTKDTNIIYSHFRQLLDVLAKWESVLYPEKLEKMCKKDLARLNHIIKLGNTGDGKSQDEFEDVRNDILTQQLENLQGEPNYYKLKLQATSQDVEKVKHSVCAAYIRGLCWVLKYYTLGCQAWGWSYDYHYAPLATDLANYCFEKEINDGDVDTSQIQFDLGAPLQPLAHLLSVLPVYSGKFLPTQLANLMKPPSPLATYYREKYRIDLNGEEVSWKGVILVNFIDVPLLESLANPIIEELSKTDSQIRKLNKLGNDVYYHLNNSSNGNGNNDNNKNNNNNNNQRLNDKDFKWATRYLITLSPFNSDLYNSL